MSPTTTSPLISAAELAARIPGSVSVPTELNLADDGTFRPAQELRELYAAVGAPAGVDAALYPGSWSGWVTDAARPVERG